MRSVILVIDDDNSISELLATVIKKHGFTPITASNGKEALDILKGSFLPALIITDYSMPTLNGGELIEILSMKPGYSQIPAIMITGSSIQDLKLPRTSNFKGILLKPFDLSTISDVITEYAYQEESYNLA